MKLPWPRLSFRIWGVNRFLRFTGVRLFVEIPLPEEDGFTSVGLGWYGFPWTKGWRKIEGT